MIKSLKIPSIFKPLFKGELSHYREIFYRGGRGSGKTTNVTIFLALKFLQEDNCKILCLREYAKSTSDSVKAEFDAFFQDYGFDAMSVEDGVISYSENKRNRETIVRIKTTTITNTLNNNKIIFAGITRHTVRALKSLKGIKYCFIDESDFLGEVEYRILKPTIRADDAQIFCCFNPKSEDDYIYQLSTQENARRYSRVVNYKDNPFFPKVLDDDREDDLKTLPYPVYSHIWLGECLENVEGVIFSNETIALMKKTPTIKTFYRERYSKVIVSCDPATTSKDYSNEYGIIVLGLVGSMVEVIDDLSSNLTPEQFASAVEDAYFSYKCDYCVVETNQGGDFIRHSIITKNPLIVVKEVRAVKDKVNRATPVANMASLGRVVLANQNREKLLRQMKRLTNKGYLGIKGESPDRLDAMVWGVYDLLGISEYGTAGKVFKESMLYTPIEGVLQYQNICYAFLNGYGFCAIVFNIYGFSHSRKFEILDCIVGETSESMQIINTLNATQVFINKGDFNSLASDLEVKCFFYNESDNDLDNLVSKAVTKIRGVVDLSKCKEREFEGFSLCILKDKLLKFDYNAENISKLSELPVKVFCEMILNEA